MMLIRATHCFPGVGKSWWFVKYLLLSCRIHLTKSTKARSSSAQYSLYTNLLKVTVEMLCYLFLWGFFCFVFYPPLHPILGFPHMSNLFGCGDKVMYNVGNSKYSSLIPFFLSLCSGYQMFKLKNLNLGWNTVCIFLYWCSFYYFINMAWGPVSWAAITWYKYPPKSCCLLFYVEFRAWILSLLLEVESALTLTRVF